jgi:hypothetical protein
MVLEATAVGSVRRIALGAREVEASFFVVWAAGHRWQAGGFGAGDDTRDDELEARFNLPAGSVLEHGTEIYTCDSGFKQEETRSWLD